MGLEPNSFRGPSTNNKKTFLFSTRQASPLCKKLFACNAYHVKKTLSVGCRHLAYPLFSLFLTYENFPLWSLFACSFLTSPFLLDHRCWSFCMHRLIFSFVTVPFLFNERRQSICFPKSKSRFCASIPCQWLASKERTLLFFNTIHSQSYSISKDPRISPSSLRSLLLLFGLNSLSSKDFIKSDFWSARVPDPAYSCCPTRNRETGRLSKALHASLCWYT